MRKRQPLALVEAWKKAEAFSEAWGRPKLAQRLGVCKRQPLPYPRLGRMPKLAQRLGLPTVNETISLFRCSAACASPVATACASTVAAACTSTVAAAPLASTLSLPLAHPLSLKRRLAPLALPLSLPLAHPLSLQRRLQAPCRCRLRIPSR